MPAFRLPNWAGGLDYPRPPLRSESIRWKRRESFWVIARRSIRPKLGFAILAFITVKVSGENLIHFMNLAASRPEVLECHRVTGADSFLLKTAVSDVAHLERLLDALMPYVATTTLMVLSTALAWGNIVKPDSESQDAAAARPAFR